MSLPQYRGQDYKAPKGASANTIGLAIVAHNLHAIFTEARTARYAAEKNTFHQDAYGKLWDVTHRNAGSHVVGDRLWAANPDCQRYDAITKRMGEAYRSYVVPEWMTDEECQLTQGCNVSELQAYWTARKAEDEALAAHSAAVDAAYASEMADAGFPENRDSVAKVVRKQLKNGKWALFCISKTGGRYLARVATRPYVSAWISPTLDAATCSINPLTPNGNGDQYIFEVTEEKDEPTPTKVAPVAEVVPVVTEPEPTNKEPIMSQTINIATIAQLEAATGLVHHIANVTHSPCPKNREGEKEETPVLTIATGTTLPLRTWKPDESGRLRWKLADLNAVYAAFLAAQKPVVEPVRPATPPKEKAAKPVKPAKTEGTPRSKKMLPTDLATSLLASGDVLVTSGDEFIVQRKPSEGDKFIAVRLNGWMKVRASCFPTLEAANASREDKDRDLVVLAF